MSPPLDRTALYQLLLALPPPQFEALLFDLNPPKGNVSPPTAPQGQRVPELLTWVDSPVGPGLEALRISLEKWAVVADLSSPQDDTPPPDRLPPQKTPLLLARLGGLALASGLAMASLVSVVRFFGAFEPLELMAYDHVLTARPAEPRSDRIIVLEANRAVVDAEQLKEPKNLAETLSDATLTAAIQKLQAYGVSVIGVDWYLPDDLTQWSASVLPIFQAPGLADHSRIYGLYLQPYQGRTGEENSVPAPHPQAIPPERVGFSNFAIHRKGEGENVLRRQIVSNGLGDTVTAPPCPSTQAFSTLMALGYLEANHPDLGPFTPPDFSRVLESRRNRWLLGRATLNGLSSYSFIYGGYQDLEPGIFELMLNYREPAGNDLRAAFTHKSLYDLLENRLDPAAFQGKVALLGLTDDTRISDRFLTPYGDELGVTLHAHMVDHLISLALGERRQIWVWTRVGEFAWILLWSLLGGGFGLLGRHRPGWLAGSLAAGLLGIYLSSRLAMGTVALWLPMVPPMVAFVLAQGTVVYTEATLQLTRSNHSKIKP
ncbi:CHASE2 domain-containing protein [Phormidium sp. FACHB-1136]|uniref:CHASE2 domain-containing protein n=1 Tax=Phormidium sp. FACHB-1136 TaxID=2692848 RepID=UPI001681F5C9|nr:CHASE2 domain-containing protein [Phormidium sp. FACHB-1136]MBD2427327.1 CHASE2 domain-containing protein [Phormidium sp. FACHB-1136]